MGSYTARELERDTGFGRRTIAYYVQEGLLPRVGRRGPRTRYPELVRDRLLFIRRVRETEEAGEIAPVPLSDLRKMFRHAPRELIAGVAEGSIGVTSDLVSPPAIELRSMRERSVALADRLSEMRGEMEAEADSAGTDMDAEARPPSMREPAAEVQGLAAREPTTRPRPSAWEQWVSMDEGSSRSPAPAAEGIVGMAPPPDDGGTQLHENAPEIPGFALPRVLRMLQVAARRRQELSSDPVDTWTQIDVTPDIRLSVRGMAEEDAPLLRWVGRLLRRLVEDNPREGDE